MSRSDTPRALSHSTMEEGGVPVTPSEDGSPLSVSLEGELEGAGDFDGLLSTNPAAIGPDLLQYLAQSFETDMIAFGGLPLAEALSLSAHEIRGSPGEAGGGSASKARATQQDRPLKFPMESMGFTAWLRHRQV